MQSASQVTQTQKQKPMPTPRKWLGLFKTLGPGLITGASDDDPATIGTYAQTGAQFGITQLWVPLYTLPLTIVIQQISARVALETGAGLASNIRRHYPKPILYFCLLLLFVANIVNIGADLGAMAASAQMLLNLPFLVWLIGITVVSAGLEIFLAYRQYARILRVLAMLLLVYVLVGLTVSQQWGQVLTHLVIPTIQLDKNFLMNIVALLGTSLSPYLYFWEAGEEVEEKIEEHGTEKVVEGQKVTEQARPGVSKRHVKHMRFDVTSGVVIANLVAAFIIITFAATLAQHGITNIDSAPQAAESLRPIAGNSAFALFALGIIGTGMLSVPVLAGSLAYAVSETLELREGLYRDFSDAPGFYAVIAIATVVGGVINLIGINPIQALYYTSVLNGLVAPPLLVMLLLISNRRETMNGHVNAPVTNVIGWLTAGIMTIAAIALLALLVFGR